MLPHPRLLRQLPAGAVTRNPAPAAPTSALRSAVQGRMQPGLPGRLATRLWKWLLTGAAVAAEAAQRWRHRHTSKHRINSNAHLRCLGLEDWDMYVPYTHHCAYDVPKILLSCQQCCEGQATSPSRCLLNHPLGIRPTSHLCQAGAKVNGAAVITVLEMPILLAVWFCS